MCLGVPGQIVKIDPDPLGMTMGKVSFAGITKTVCLAYTPEVEVGDYVVVHVGFSIARIDEEQAQEVFRYLEEMGELDELEIGQPAAGDTGIEAATEAAAVPAAEPAPGRPSTSTAARRRPASCSTPSAPPAPGAGR